MITEAQLIGDWSAAGQAQFSPDGTLLKSVPAGAPGRIIYTPDHHVMVVSVEAIALPQGDPDGLSDAEAAAAARACTAYSGRWELEGDRLLHHIDIALFPAWAGKTRVRFPSLDGDLLTFKTLPDSSGVVTHIYWRRL